MSNDYLLCIKIDFKEPQHKIQVYLVILVFVFNQNSQGIFFIIFAYLALHI